mgnify:CR=1 FL=1
MKNQYFDNSLDAPLVPKNLADVLKVCKRPARSTNEYSNATLVQIENAARYISSLLGRLMNYNIKYEEKAFEDMYRAFNFYDVIEYKCESVDLKKVKDYNPADMSIGFMQPIINEMMQSEIDLDDFNAFYKNNDGRLLLFFTDMYYNNGNMTVGSLSTDSNREEFQKINSFIGNRVLRPKKIYFRLIVRNYPTELHMDIYPGFVDLGISDYKLLCISYKLYFYEENSTDYLIS